MSNIAIKAENISKAYQLGEFSTGTLSRDIERRWALLRGKEDPFLKIGEANDRTSKGESDIVWSLRDINFEIKQGDAVGIIGRNGAGKSTLLKVLSRVTSPTAGQIKVKGRIASLLEVGTGFHPELTGRENIFLNGAILGMRKHEIKKHFDNIVDFAGVERYVDTPVKRYSSGMYVRLAFAVAAHLDSEILVVDEVLAVGDAEFQKKCLGKMNDVSKGEGRTVLFVSHSMPSIKNLCNNAILLSQGSVMKQGSTQEVVDFYSSNFYEFNKDSSVKITSTNRPYKTSLDMEYLNVAFHDPQVNNYYSTKDEIGIVVTIRSKINHQNFRISVGIVAVGETPVGVFFSPESLSIKEGETKDIIIKIKDHQLAKGQYYFNFSVGIGNEIVGITDFDIIMQTLFLEIAYKDTSHEDMITLWGAQWGCINFQNTEIKEL